MRSGFLFDGYATAGESIPADVAVEEAEHVAAEVGGYAFARQPILSVSGETEVLQGIGETDLECGDTQEDDDDDRAGAHAVYLTRGLSPLDVSVAVPLSSGQLVEWQIRKGQSFRETANEFRKHHKEEPHYPARTSGDGEHGKGPDYYEQHFRNEATKKAVLGESQCLPSPNYKRLAAGRLRSDLSHNVEALLLQYAFQGHPHVLADADVTGNASWNEGPDGDARRTVSAHPVCAGACDWDAEVRTCADANEAFRDFTARMMAQKQRPGAWSERAPTDDELATAALLTLEAGGAALRARPTEFRVGPRLLPIVAPFRDVCYSYLFASASFVLSWASPALPPVLAREMEGGGREERGREERGEIASGGGVPEPGGGGCTERYGQELHNTLSVLSLSWIILKAVPGPNPYGVALTDVVREAARRIKAYTACVSAARTLELQRLVPIKYGLRHPLPQGKYPREANMLEHLEPDGTTFLAREFGRGNPIAFHILPWFPSFQQLLPSFRRRVLVDAGSAGFTDGSKWLLDMYADAAKFTDAFLVDPRMVEGDIIPSSYEQDYNITKVQRAIRVGTRDAHTDLLLMLASESWDLAEDDFVVLKFDCDSGAGDSASGSIEWGFLADLVYHPEFLKLVDEIYIEMHFFYPSHWGAHFSTHTMWQHFDVLRQLRTQGIPIHVWP